MSGSFPPRGVIAHFASGEAIVRYEPAPPMLGTTGDIEALSMWAGQDIALVRHSQSAAEIVTELISRLWHEPEALGPFAADDVNWPQQILDRPHH